MNRGGAIEYGQSAMLTHGPIHNGSNKLTLISYIYTCACKWTLSSGCIPHLQISINMYTTIMKARKLCQMKFCQIFEKYNKLWFRKDLR